MKKKFKIDNVGKIYTRVSSEKNPNIFRISINLTEKVKANVLKRAANDIMPRFPTFKTKARAGVFWEYLVYNKLEVEVYPINDNEGIYNNLAKKNNRYLFRISSRGKSINLDVHHSLSDGYGGLTFLQSLVYRYLTLCGKDLKPDADVKTADQKPTAEELEDSLTTYYDRRNSKSSTAGRAFHIKGKPLPQGISVTRIKWRAEQLLQLTRKTKTTVTEYLAALLACSIYKSQLAGKEGGENLPIRICISYDLRRAFKSQTLKNFSNYLKTNHIFTETTSFEDVLAEAKRQINLENNPYFLIRRANSTVKFERNFFINLVPFFIKSPVMKYIYKKMSNEVITTSFSNLGVIKFSESIKDYISDCEVNLFTSGFSTCAVTYNGVTQMSFNKTIEETDIEKIFIQHLVEQGVEVQVL